MSEDEYDYYRESPAPPSDDDDDLKGANQVSSSALFKHSDRWSGPAQKRANLDQSTAKQGTSRGQYPDMDRRAASEFPGHTKQRSSNARAKQSVCDPAVPVNFPFRFAGPAHGIGMQGMQILENNGICGMNHTILQQVLFQLSQIQTTINHISASQAEMQEKLDIPRDVHAALPDNPVRERSAYPDVTFWYKRDWHHFSGNKDGISGRPRPGSDNSSSSDVQLVRKYWFLEDEDGQLISRERLREIGDGARALFEEFHQRSKAPLSWEKHAAADIRGEFAKRMEHSYEELQYCASSWKSHEIAILLYPGWKANRPEYFLEQEEAKATAKMRTREVKVSQHADRRQFDDGEVETERAPHSNLSRIPLALGKRSAPHNANPGREPKKAKRSALDKGKGRATAPSSAAADPSTQDTTSQTVARNKVAAGRSSAQTTTPAVSSSRSCAHADSTSDDSVNSRPAQTTPAHHTSSGLAVPTVASPQPSTPATGSSPSGTSAIPTGNSPDSRSPSPAPANRCVRNTNPLKRVKPRRIIRSPVPEPEGDRTPELDTSNEDNRAVDVDNNATSMSSVREASPLAHPDADDGNNGDHGDVVTPTSARRKPLKVYMPGTTNTLKNIFGREWIKKNPGGADVDFKRAWVIFESEPDEVQRMKDGLAKEGTKICKPRGGGRHQSGTK